MLQSLFIQNYLLINELELEFDAHLNILTGETGAGKSILLGAMGLIRGHRADLGVLSDKSKKCIVEAIFKLDETRFKPWFEQNEIEFHKHCIIRREISPSGRSRAFINDAVQPLEVLKHLGFQLIDIHSQHDTLLINNAEVQLNLIDTFAQNNKQLEAFQKAFTDYKRHKKALEEFLNTHKNFDASYVSYQHEELEKLNLKKGESEDLTRQLKQAENTQQIASVKDQISSLLYNEQFNVIARLHQIKQELSNLENIFGAQIIERLSSLIIELEDIENEVSSRGTENFSFEEIQNIEKRLDKINALAFKHNTKYPDELINIMQDFEEQLNANQDLEAKKNKIQQAVDKAHEKALKQAKALSASRKKHILVIAENIEHMLSDLNMPSASIQINVSEQETLTQFGIDKIEFLLKTNEGSDFKPIKKAASGGELSRIMLAFKTLLSQKIELPCLIFDEIDTGVSGQTAEKVGSAIEKISKDNQLIVITHLVQVACKKGRHFKVEKHAKTGQTHTTVKTLDKTQRLESLAQMLSGKEITQSALQHAKNLLEAV